MQFSSGNNFSNFLIKLSIATFFFLFTIIPAFAQQPPTGSSDCSYFGSSYGECTGGGQICTGSQVFGTCWRWDCAGQGFIGGGTEYTGDCSIDGGPANQPPPPPSCRSFNQSCSGGGQGNCCGGLTCDPQGKSGSLCKRNGCAGSGQTGSDYASGCCAGTAPTGKGGTCQCTTPAAPYSLNPNNTAVCPTASGTLSWQPAGKTYDIYVEDNNTSASMVSTCNTPSGKDNRYDECTAKATNSHPFAKDTGHAYNWQVRSRNTLSGCNQPSAKSSASFTVSSAPNAPTNLRPTNTTTAGAQNILWTAPSNADSNTRYNLYIDDEQNGWNGSCSSPLAGDSCALARTTTSYNYTFLSGHSYHLWVNASSCSFPASAQADSFVSVPPPYPDVTIHGKLREYSSGVCNDNISTTSQALSVAPQSSQGVSSSCTVTPASGGTAQASYSCTVTFDVFANADVSQNLTLNYSTTEYKPPYLTDADVCAASGTNTVAVDLSGASPTTDFPKDLVFKPAGAWVKIKNGSFASALNVANPIPNTISAFDSEDDISQRYFIMNTAGNSPGAVVAQGLNLGTADASSEDWKATGYQKSNTLTFSNYFDYVKARKEYENITNSDLSEITDNGIYVWTGSGDLTLNNSNESRLTGKVVLISSGEINIDEDFTPTGSVGIFADEITFTGGATPVTQAKGIFVSNTMNAESADQGLKITGNFVTQTLNNDRGSTDTSKPSIFVSFSPSLFMDLLPWASISKYEYRQTQ